jgi:hypothetical protein
MSQFSDALFIGGSGRSGTTIAGKLLSRHQEVVLAKPIEIKFLTSGNGLLDLYLNPRISRSGKVRVRPNANLKRFMAPKRQEVRSDRVINRDRANRVGCIDCKSTGRD